jgi:hypothetical protein
VRAKPDTDEGQSKVAYRAIRKSTSIIQAIANAAKEWSEKVVDSTILALVGRGQPQAQGEPLIQDVGPLHRPVSVTLISNQQRRKADNAGQ